MNNNNMYMYMGMYGRTHVDRTVHRVHRSRDRSRAAPATRHAANEPSELPNLHDALRACRPGGTADRPAPGSGSRPSRSQYE